MPLETSPEITLPDAVSRAVLHLNDRVLGLAAGLGFPVALGLLLLAREWYPLAFGVGGAALLAGWGLLRHHEPVPAPRTLRGLEWLLISLAVGAALIAGFGGFFWLMGPAPIL
jgi:O-antigen/teichoic acid export membrane protein